GSSSTAPSRGAWPARKGDRSHGSLERRSGKRDLGRRSGPGDAGRGASPDGLAFPLAVRDRGRSAGGASVGGTGFPGSEAEPSDRLGIAATAGGTGPTRTRGGSG